ncbi:sigma factor [Oceanobacillus salinisoli]|uniref:sigma factor n=1 Tax=Oceanobacillus salinisoli TaxID=2678611 RepID=UPI0038B3DD80
MYAMWTAYQKYEPDKGTLTTYFNYTIRNRLIDLIVRKSMTNKTRNLHRKRNFNFL